MAISRNATVLHGAPPASHCRDHSTPFIRAEHPRQAHGERPSYAPTGHPAIGCNSYFLSEPHRFGPTPGRHDRCRLRAARKPRFATIGVAGLLASQLNLLISNRDSNRLVLVVLIG